jgi:hypothetical protein
MAMAVNCGNGVPISTEAMATILTNKPMEKLAGVATLRPNTLNFPPFTPSLS